MSRAGQLVRAEVQRYEDSRRSKGWALCEYETYEGALLAVSTLDRQELYGRQVHLRLDRNSQGSINDGAHRVFVGNLEWTVTEGDIMSIFDPFSPLGCHLVTNMYGRSRGFAILKFAAESNAISAIEKMNKVVLNDRPLEVRFDRGNGRTADDGGDGRLSVYVGRLSNSVVDDDGLHAIFRHIGPITSAKLQLAPNGRSKGWGIVCFSSAADGRTAVDTMNGHLIPGSPNTLEVRFDRK